MQATAPITATTERVFYKDSYLDKLDSTTVVHSDKDENGTFVIFDRTLFHPQGGGQPSDKGFFTIGDRKYSVIGLAEDEKHTYVKHYYEPGSFDLIKAGDEEHTYTRCRYESGVMDLVKVGQVALQVIELEPRRLYARLHSGGHLLADVIHELYPHLEGMKGNHFEGKSCVVFEGKPIPNAAEIKKTVAEKVQEQINANLPVQIIFDEEGRRSIQMGAFSPSGCGGTHVQNTSEIGIFSIRSVGKDSGNLKIGYDIKFV